MSEPGNVILDMHLIHVNLTISHLRCHVTITHDFLAETEHCTCMTEFGYCYKMLSVVVIAAKLLILITRFSL